MVVTPFDPGREIAADLDTPVSALLKLRPLDPVFLLESAAGGERIGRFSFLGLGTHAEVVLERGALTVGDGRSGVRREERFDVDPLVALRAWLQEARLHEAALPRGPSGLVGYVGYEAGAWFERLPVPGPSPLGLPTAAFVVPRAILAFDHVRSTITLHPLVAEDEGPALAREVQHALRSRAPEPPGPASSSRARPNHDREAFTSAVARAREHIHAGDAYQVVLSVRFEGESEADPLGIYRALRLLNPSPYLYWLRVAGADLVGSSPEALARLEGRTAWLRPIAGTRPRGASPEEDGELAVELAADAKENAEHTMLVDLARNDLGRVAMAGTVRVSELKTLERYSHVMHLVSTVEGVLAPGADQFDLFRAAFPAGTVTGAPKIRAMEIVADLEGEARGPYAGAVGYFGSDGSMDQAIAIRTLIFRDGRYAYQAGAGIVADSEPEREHAEVIAKARVLDRALELAGEPL
jgi:anthranilate synthase component 1